MDYQGGEGGGGGSATDEYPSATQRMVWEICSAFEWGEGADKKKLFTVGEWTTHLVYRSLDQWHDRAAQEPN